MKNNYTGVFFTFALLSCFAIGAEAQPISLEQAIREVCTNSDSLKRMHESLKKSEQMVREKWSNALPVISANATAARSHGSIFGGSSGSSSTRSLEKVSSHPSDTVQVTKHAVDSIVQVNVGKGLQQFSTALTDNFSKPQTSTVYNVGLSVSQPLYTFGKIGTAIKVARQFDQAAKYSFQRNFQTLQLQAFDAFSQALLAEKAKAVSARSLARKKERYDFLERNFRLGSGSKAQVLSLKADVAGQNTMVLIAQRDARTAHMYLNALMGRSIADSSEFDTATGLSALLNTPVDPLDKAIPAALANRVDVKSMDLMGKSTEGAVKIFRSMYYPSIAGFGSVGYSKYESGSGLLKMDWTGNWTVGVGMQWTLFDGFAYNAKAAQYASDERKLEIAKNELSKYIEIEIRTAIAECSAADSNFAASQEMYAAAKESYDLTNSNFKQGSGQFADLQLADEQLMQAELGQANARYRLLRSRAALQVSMGNDIIAIK
jgi:outer membrane protein